MRIARHGIALCEGLGSTDQEITNMYSPTPEPRILAGSIRPVDCFKDAFEVIKPQYGLFFGIVFVGGLLVGFSCGIVSAAIYCGFALCYLARTRGQFIEFGLLFKGFDFFSRSILIFVVWLALYLITSVPYIVITVATNPQLNPNAPKGLEVFIGSYAVQILTAFVQMIIEAFMMFSCLFVVDRGQPAVEAMRSSMRLISTNLGGVLVLAILSALASTLGFFACCIGVFFVMPIIRGAPVIAYLQAVPEANQPVGVDAQPPPSEWRPPYG